VLKLPKISLGRSYSPLIGLDITTSSIKLIELSQSGGQYRVEAYAAEPTPHNAINEKAIVDAAAVGDAIRRAVKRSGVRAKECAVAISGDAAITKAVQMPKNLSDADLEREYKRRNEKVTLDIVSVLADNFKTQVTPTDAEIAEISRKVVASAEKLGASLRG